jgi:outer membrane lipoprotein-sorting protein
MVFTAGRPLLLPALCGLALLAAAAMPGVAQNAPLSLTPNAPAAPPAAATPPATPRAAPAAQTPTTNRPAPAAEMTREQMLSRVNASLNAMTTVVSDFRQVSPDGKPFTGRLYMQRPGKLRFEYTAPAPYLIVADGRNVAVYDRKLNSRDMYGINQTPLKFLTAERIDLARDAKLVSIGRDGASIAVVIEDKNTVAGTSRIKLWFGGPDYVLQRWLVTDPQGYDTQVVLSNLDLTTRPAPRQFIIDVLNPQ